MEIDTSVGQAKDDIREDIDDNKSGDSDDDLLPWSPRIVHIRAAITQLDTHIIPFVVLKNDPRAAASFEPETRRIYIEQAHNLDEVRVWWDGPLHELPVRQNYFLVAWSALAGVSPRITPLAGLSFGIATPGPYYRRWITTAALEYHDELVAWCEEIDMSGMQEEIIEVVLSEERMIRLLPGHSGTAERSIKVT